MLLHNPFQRADSRKTLTGSHGEILPGRDLRENFLSLLNFGD